MAIDVKAVIEEACKGKMKKKEEMEVEEKGKEPVTENVEVMTESDFINELKTIFTKELKTISEATPSNKDDLVSGLWNRVSTGASDVFKKMSGQKSTSEEVADKARQMAKSAGDAVSDVKTKLTGGLHKASDLANEHPGVAAAGAALGAGLGALAMRKKLAAMKANKNKHIMPSA